MTTTPVYAIIVKLDNGRMWYRADSFSTADRELIIQMYMDMRGVPGLEWGFDQINDKTEYKMAPSKIFKMIDEG